MIDENVSEPEGVEPKPRWQPLRAIDRRVAGVLAEKAKTTPNAYPMSLNAICTGCNQKSNRAPVMQLEPEDVEESLERIRKLGAVGMIEGYGRVNKYRHYLYEWLAVDKVELAVMAELLLRGTQTEGELRGRAARMEPIGDLAELRPVLASLKSKGLVIPLTPEGRGHVVTHALYEPAELDKIKAEYRQSPAGVATVASGRAMPAAPAGAPSSQPPAPGPSAPTPAASAAVAVAGPVESEVAQALHRGMDELRQQIAQLRSDLDDLSAEQSRIGEELRELRDALGV